MIVLATSAIRAAVDRGVKVLDHEHPTWRDSIDPTKLEMTNSRCCVLGQVFDAGPFACDSGYMIGLLELGLLPANNGHLGIFNIACHHGFAIDVPLDASTDDWMAAWDGLRAEWLRRLP